MSAETKERRTVSRAEWQAEAETRFGSDPLDWRFRCVRCGHVQTGRQLVERYGLTPGAAMARAYFSCEGRISGHYGPGCDWSLGGLFQIHTVEVVTEDGESVPSFEFAEPEPARAVS